MSSGFLKTQCLSQAKKTKINDGLKREPEGLFPVFFFSLSLTKLLKGWGRMFYLPYWSFQSSVSQCRWEFLNTFQCAWFKECGDFNGIFQSDKECSNLKFQGHLERVSVDVWKHNLISTTWNGYVTCVVSSVSRILLTLFLVLLVTISVMKQRLELPQWRYSLLHKAKKIKRHKLLLFWGRRSLASKKTTAKILDVIAVVDSKCLVCILVLKAV